MTEITNLESGLSVRTKLNAALEKTDNLTAAGADLAIAGGLLIHGDIETRAGIKERNYTFPATTTPTINPHNGTHQKITLTGATTFSVSMEDGESVTLLVLAGDQHTVTWFPVTWVTDLGTEPVLRANDAVTFWRFGDTVYAAHIGGWS